MVWDTKIYLVETHFTSKPTLWVLYGNVFLQGRFWSRNDENYIYLLWIPGPQICCHYKMCTAWPQNEHSPWKLCLCDIGEKAKQNSAKNNVKCSRCFQFLYDHSDRTWFFNVLTFARSLGRCWKPWPLTLVFSTSHRTWQMLMHEKPC